MTFKRPSWWDDLERYVTKNKSCLSAPPNIEKEVEALSKRLASDEALASIARDPYWPKWDSPWWHAQLLFEIGRADAIPRVTAYALAASVDKNQLHFFPLVEAELPKNIDPYREIICHCALGCLWRLISACKINVDETLPWFRPWCLKYQLPDGGLNCDEAPYTRDIPKSSIVSTLPPMEAILYETRRPFTEEEKTFLEKGASYLLNHKLCRSAGSAAKLLDPNWLNPVFPRFYHYDVLRGLSYLVNWAKRTENPLPLAPLNETMERLLSDTWKDSFNRRSTELATEGTLTPNTDGTWDWGSETPSFSLLETCSKSTYWIEKQLAEVAQDLLDLANNDQLLNE